jgi:hypothetical protein
MSQKRGREARLKTEHAPLYPGIEPGVWMPVESLLRHITDLVHHDSSKARVITGTRLLHQEHFEYRGSSARPEGLPEGSTRLSDSGAQPGRPDATDVRSPAHAPDERGGHRA